MRDRIGVDIVSAARVQALLGLHGSELARRLLTERELLFHEGTALLPWMHIAVVRGPSGAL